MSDFMTPVAEEGITNSSDFMTSGTVAPTIQDGDSYMWNLDADLKIAMQRFMDAARGRIEVISGYRDDEHQERLWNAALEKYGDPEIADNWVARPGTSNHGKGQAMDLSYMDDETKEWAHANAAQFGLEFPMAHEPWHVELAGHAGGTSGKDLPNRGAYTMHPGSSHPMDRKDPMASYAHAFTQSLATQQTETQSAPGPSELSGDVADEGGMIHG